MSKNLFNPSRRSFLRQGTKLTAALGIGSTAMGSAFLSACSSPQQSSSAAISTGFSQSDLPYDYGALEPHIDAMTMEIHYTRHAAGYANNLSDAAAEENVDMEKPLEEVLMNISKYSTKMRNNGGGHFNHELFWNIMSPDGGGSPEGDLAAAINASFGNFEDFAAQFETAAATRFGSGWAWLVVDASNQLAIGSTPNQDNPLMDIAEFKGIPLLGIDVWEHAYYLNYQNERGRYISSWWNLVNWKAVEERYRAVTA